MHDMTTWELRQLLEHVEDTREIVLREPGRFDGSCELDERKAVWSAARAEANLAYDAWRSRGDRETYSVYRAAEDRADAAEDALAAASGRVRPPAYRHIDRGPPPASTKSR